MTFLSFRLSALSGLALVLVGCSGLAAKGQALETLFYRDGTTVTIEPYAPTSCG